MLRRLLSLGLVLTTLAFVVALSIRAEKSSLPKVLAAVGRAELVGRAQE